MAVLIPPDIALRFLPVSGYRQKPSVWHLIKEWHEDRPRKTVCGELPNDPNGPPWKPFPWELSSIDTISHTRFCANCLGSMTAVKNTKEQNQLSLF